MFLGGGGWIGGLMIKIELENLLIDDKRYPLSEMDKMSGNHTVGWAFSYLGENYGGCIVTKKPTNDILKECLLIFQDQISSTIKELLAEQMGGYKQLLFSGLVDVSSRIQVEIEKKPV